MHTLVEHNDIRMVLDYYSFFCYFLTRQYLPQTQHCRNFAVITELFCVQAHEVKLKEDQRRMAELHAAEVRLGSGSAIVCMCVLLGLARHNPSFSHPIRY